MNSGRCTKKLFEDVKVPLKEDCPWKGCSGTPRPATDESEIDIVFTRCESPESFD